MHLLGTLIGYIVIGGLVGWVVSLIRGRDFKGGCLTHVGVGMVVMLVVGLLLKLIWALAAVVWVLVLIGLVVVGVAWVVKALKAPSE